MPVPAWSKWMMRAAVIPAAVAGYIAVAGTTGFCPSCKAVVDSIRGRHDAMVRPAGAAPTIAGLTAYTLDGDPVELAASSGRPMILELWATWCGPCHRQRAIIKGMGDDLASQADLVSLSVDTDPRVVAKFLHNNPSTMIELMAPTEMLAAFGGVREVPTLVFVDAAGAIRGVGSGVHSASLLRARVAELLAPTAAN